MSITSLERSHSCASSTSLSMSSPRPSRRETTPSGSELSLTHLHDRIYELDSRVLELRSTVLTKDGYVDRRNREDEHIRHEFQNHRAISQRIDLNVVALRSDIDALRSNVDQIKTSIFQLKSSVGQAQTETVFLREDVDRLQKTVDQLLTDIEQMRSDACVMRIDISKLQTVTSQLRTDFLNLEHKMSHQFNLLNTRMEKMECRMEKMECRMEKMECRMEKMECHMDKMASRSRVDRRIGLNSLAVTVGARVLPVPVETDDGLKWPQYSPRTVWKFWCLKKRSRIHRLIELAEFYQLGDYQYWSRMHSANFFADDSDSSKSSDDSMNITRAEAVRRFPEAAHQALAAALGLKYHKIRKEMGEGPYAVQPRPPKRQQDDAASAGSNAKSKPVKMARRPSVTELRIQRSVPGPAVLESKSSASEELDRLGWDPFPDVSEDGVNKLRSMDPHDVNAILRALERGRLKLKPSESEKARMSPTGSKASHAIGRAATADPGQAEVHTGPNTIPTEPFSSVAGDTKPAPMSNVPEAASDTDSAAS